MSPNSNRKLCKILFRHPPQPKRRRHRRSAFVLHEADVSGDESGEDDEDEDSSDISIIDQDDDQISDDTDFYRAFDNMNDNNNNLLPTFLLRS